MVNAILALLILATDLPADTDRGTPDADIVFSGDFEQSTDRNHDDWPDNWTRRRGAGYPTYLPVKIVDDQLATDSTNRCLHFGLDGGAVELYSPTISVVPQFSYQLSGRLRTEGLKHDVVSLSVAFYDGGGTLLEVHESPPVRDARQWQNITIGPITPAGDRVRTATVSIHLRPTDQVDLVGACFVDDLSLSRLPKLVVSLAGEHGIFADPQSVQVNCRVSGFKALHPTIQLELLDAYGKTLNKSAEVLVSDATPVSLATTPGTQQQGYSGSVSWHPPVTTSGFYSARVSTMSESGVSMHESINFVVLPSLRKGRPGEFGWSLGTGDRPVPIRALPSLLGHAGIHWVKYPVWFSSDEHQRAEDIAWLAERLNALEIEMVGLLDHPPRDVQSYFGVTGPMPIATAFSDKSVWHPALDPVMMRLSLKIRWWQLGRDGDTSFSSQADLANRLQAIRKDLADFGQRVKVGIPWRIIEENPIPALGPWAFLSYLEDLPLTHDELPSYVAPEADGQFQRWLMLQPLSAREYGLEARAMDLVKRMVAAKTAKIGAVFVPEPFDADRGLMEPNGSPGPLLLPWRTTSVLIGGGAYSGSIRLPNHSDNHVFIHDDDAVMVVWNPLPTFEPVFLGAKIRQFDIWGRELLPAATDSPGIQVGPLPTFVTGVNAELAHWRRDFRFETKQLASIFGRDQSIAYQFANSFPQGVSGRTRFRLPAEWHAEQVERTFKLEPGEIFRDSLSVQLGADASSGSQPIQVDFEITGSESHRFSLNESIHVGLGDILVEMASQLDESGNLVVEQFLTNNTDQPVSFKFYLSAPGRRRERRQVFNQGRGRVSNTYVLPNGAELIGQTIWLRAEEINGERIFNDHITVPD